MPTANYTIVGSNAVEFGTDGAGATGLGVITSCTRKDGGDKLEIKDRQGNVYIVIYFNAKGECELEVIYDSTLTVPDRGDSMMIGGSVTCLVDEVEHKWSNEKERSMIIRATKYTQLNLGA